MAKATSKKPPKGKVLISMNVPAETVEKLKHIARKEGVGFVDVYIKAFNKLIELWEKKFGEIKPGPTGGGLNRI